VKFLTFSTSVLLHVDSQSVSLNIFDVAWSSSVILVTDSMNGLRNQ